MIISFKTKAKKKKKQKSHDVLCLREKKKIKSDPGAYIKSKPPHYMFVICHLFLTNKNKVSCLLELRSILRGFPFPINFESR